MGFLDKAPKEAFDKKNPQRFPRFKKKGQGIDFLRYPQGFKLDGARVFLPKRGWVRFINSREIEATAGNVTVSRRGNHWPVSIQTEREVEDFKRRDMSRPASATSEATGKKRMLMRRWWWNPRPSGRGEFQDGISVPYRLASKAQDLWFLAL
jgi:transposase